MQQSLPKRVPSSNITESRPPPEASSLCIPNHQACTRSGQANDAAAARADRWRRRDHHALRTDMSACLVVPQSAKPSTSAMHTALARRPKRHPCSSASACSIFFAALYFTVAASLALMAYAAEHVFRRSTDTVNVRSTRKQHCYSGKVTQCPISEHDMLERCFETRRVDPVTLEPTAFHRMERVHNHRANMRLLLCCTRARTSATKKCHCIKVVCVPGWR